MVAVIKHPVRAVHQIEAGGAAYVSRNELQVDEPRYGSLFLAGVFIEVRVPEINFIPFIFKN